MKEPPIDFVNLAIMLACIGGVYGLALLMYWLLATPIRYIVTALLGL